MKQAINSRVIDYIWKPIDEKDLNEALKKESEIEEKGDWKKRIILRAVKERSVAGK